MALIALMAMAPINAPALDIESAAKDFVDTLEPGLREKAILSKTSDERFKWNYVPMDRKGVSWAEMDEVTQRAGERLLKASLSAQGFTKVQTIRSLEQVLRELENNPARDSKKYWFAFFGQPGADQTWAWRYEGHHVSLTFVIHDGRIVASTPQFLGSNPADVKTGSKKGTRPLIQTRDLALEFVSSLSEAELHEAILSNKAPSDIVTSTVRRAAIEGHVGLAFTKMSKIQQLKLKRLIAAHADVQIKDEKQRRLEKIDYRSVVFAWSGQVSISGRHYYRIQGENFVIEYDNTQEDGNHIHTVWRDTNEDFGGDELAEHYAHSHSHH